MSYFGPFIKSALQYCSLQGGEVKVYLGSSLQGKFSPILCMHVGFLLQNKPEWGL